MFYLKVVIITISQLIPIEDEARALLILLTLMGFLHFFSINRPFLSKKLNSFHKQSVIIVILTIYFGLVVETTKNHIIDLIFSVVVFLLNIIFYCVWIIIIWIVPCIKKNQEVSVVCTFIKRKKSIFNSQQLSNFFLNSENFFKII